MSLEARIHALEALLDPGADQRIEQEHQARILFSVKLELQLLRNDLSIIRRASFEQAKQSLQALPVLPKHHCEPAAQFSGEDERDAMRQLAEEAIKPWSSKGEFRLDKEGMELWARFTPNVEFPCTGIPE